MGKRFNASSRASVRTKSKKVPGVSNTQTERSPDITLAARTGMDPDLQLYERALDLFNEGNFQAAREAFLTLANSTNRTLADNARSRVNMCERRLLNS